MSFETKIQENLNMAKESIAKNCNYNPIVSRLYYAAFLSAKDFLFKNGFTENNYWERVGKISDLRNSTFSNKQQFSHESIWKVVKFVRQNKKLSVWNTNLGIGLLEYRIKADYYFDTITVYEFKRCIEITKGILNGFGVKNEL